MNQGVRETSCTSCVHREVCMYKNEYLDILKAVSDATVNKATPDGRMSMKKVSSFDFISSIDVVCRYSTTYKNEQNWRRNMTNE